MLEVAGLNYWAIVVAWLLTSAVGAVWYSPVAFGTQWKERTGIDIMEMPERDATRTLAAVVLAALVQTVVLAVVVASVGATTAVDGLVVGLVAWLGLTAATTVGASLYLRLGWGVWWITASYHALVVAGSAMILAAWQ